MDSTYSVTLVKNPEAKWLPGFNLHNPNNYLGWVAIAAMAWSGVTLSVHSARYFNVGSWGAIPAPKAWQFFRLAAITLPVSFAVFQTRKAMVFALGVWVNRFRHKEAGDVRSNINDAIDLGAAPIKSQKFDGLDWATMDSSTTLHRIVVLEQAEFQGIVPWITSWFPGPLKVDPVSVDEWRKHGDQLILEGADYDPLPLEQIERGIAWLDAHKEEKTFVHCKSGAGRSSALVVCYQLQKAIQLKLDGVTLKKDATLDKLVRAFHSSYDRTIGPEKMIEQVSQRRHRVNLNGAQTARIHEFYVKTVRSKIKEKLPPEPSE